MMRLAAVFLVLVLIVAGCVPENKRVTERQGLIDSVEPSEYDEPNENDAEQQDEPEVVITAKDLGTDKDE